MAGSATRDGQPTAGAAAAEGNGAGTGPTGAPIPTEQLAITEVDLSEAIPSAAYGYGASRLDAHVSLAVRPDGGAQLAWINAARTKLHVTPLSPALVRSGPDVVIDAADFGGIVADNSGFAVLVAQNDPQRGTIQLDNDPTWAVHLLRFTGTTQAFDVQLTGPTGIDMLHDYSNGLSYAGALKFDGSRYAAYFVVRGGKGHWAQGHYGDKMAILSTTGAALPGGWGWGCSHNEGIAMYAAPGVLSAACMSDAYPAQGLNLMPIGGGGSHVAAEWAVAGYCGGSMGSLTAVQNHSFIAWSSRGDGTTVNQPNAVRAVHDVAIVALGGGAPRFLTQTPTRDEGNVHLSPYGADRLLLTYDVLDAAECGNGCVGQYGGTFAQVLDAQGMPVGDPRPLSAPPTLDEDLQILPSGDLAWPFFSTPRVNETRNAPISTSAVIHIAHFRVQ